MTAIYTGRKDGMIPLEILRRGFSARNIPLSKQAEERFERYAQLLVEWNEKMNLTAITEPQAIAIRHFLDSVSLLKAVELPQGASLIDVGTGAGFPAVPLKIVREDLNITLLDSLQKRLGFLQTVSAELSLPMKMVHARAEEGGRRKELREQFDFATARAVAALPMLCEYCLPYVKVNGCFVAMKGPDCAEEIASAKNAIGQLGGKLESTREETLEDGSGRTLIVIRKVKETPAAYPRQSAKIAKKPL